MQPLRLLDLYKIYGSGTSREVRAVQKMNFEVQPGEIFGLLGPNGAGKTSIISMVTTLEKPTSGDIEVFGKSVQIDPQWTKFQIGVVPQEVIPQGFFNLTEILKFQSGYYGLAQNSARIEFLLKRLDLWDHREKQVKQLSGGMKRRMMIAKALVHSPKLLLLDEPTAGVDIALRKSLWDFVLELKSQGVSILLTTHYLQEAEELCDRIGIINRGELAELGPTRQVIHSVTSRVIEITLLNGSIIRDEIPQGANLGFAIQKHKISPSDIQDVRIREGTLEEAFLKIIGGRNKA